MLIKITTFLILIAIWIGLAGFYSETQLLIFMISAPLIAVSFAIWLKILPKKNQYRLVKAALYIIWLMKEVMMSSIAVTKIAWRRNLRIQPLLEPVQSIQESDVAIVTYANSITLTPCVEDFI